MKAARSFLIGLVLGLAACAAPLPPAPTRAVQNDANGPAAVAAATEAPNSRALASLAAALPIQARLATRTPAASASPNLARPMQSTRTIVTDLTPSPGASTRSAAPFNVGAPLGNAYSLFSLALDPGRNLAYVYHATSERSGAAIAVVDLASQQVTRLIPISDKALGSSSALLLTADGRRLFVVDNGNMTVWGIDVQTGSAGQILSGVNDIALSEDGKLLFAAGRNALTAYAVGGLLGPAARPVWQNKAAFYRLAVNGGRLAALSVPQGTLALFDAATGTQLAQEPVGWVDTVAAGLDGGWAVVVNGESPQLVRYDAALKKLGATDIPYLNRVNLDATRKRFLGGGARSEGSGANSRSHAVVLAIDATDGRVAQETRWPTMNRPDVFTAWGDDRLLAFASGGPAMLYVLDAATLNVTGAIPMGARVDDLVIDGDKALYAADDLGRVHVLALPGGEETALWEGSAPLALDATNGRLYVNRNGQVAALDLKSGAVVAQFPQGGHPAADPRRDVVYIAERGITSYDRAGKKLGELPSTFAAPPGFSGVPSADSVYVNPVTGHMAVVMYNNVPGSNGGTFLRIYAPQSDTFVEPPAPHSFVMDVIPDSKGNWYVAYSTTRNQEAVQVLSPDGKELRRLDRRTGYLVLDEARDTLYLVMQGRVTRIAASTLTALETFKGPDKLGGLVFSPAAASLYLFDGTGPVINAMKTTDFAPLDLKPGAGSPSLETNNYALAVTAIGKQRVLIGQFDTTYVGADGRNWRKLLPGLGLQYAQITTVGDGTLFITGVSAYGGEGVWRWRSTGDVNSWDWLAAGLTDLAPTGPVLANSPNDAYFLNRRQGLLRWDAGARRWVAVDPHGAEGETVGYSLAPDGALFRNKAGALDRSGDRGATWQRLGAEAQTGQVIGYSALYTVTHTIYSVTRTGYQISGLQRSADGGKTWQAMNTGNVFASDGYPPELVTGFGATYVLARPYNGESSLLRTKDYGATWEIAPAGTVRDVDYIAVDPLDGRLWLGVKGGATGLDPAKLKWAPLGPATRGATGQATPIVRPTAPPVVKPTDAACTQPLMGNDAEINARGLGLGCPKGPAESIQMARQRFEYGQMIWRQDRKQIYVLQNDGHWLVYADTWSEGDPADDPSIAAPGRVQQPVRGFGKVWRLQLGGAKAKVGWAIEKEAGVLGQAQDWEHGTVLRFGGEVIVLLEGGTWK